MLWVGLLCYGKSTNSRKNQEDRTRSKISRRNFIKGAGAAALAVAAAGMLAGCGSSAPEMVDVTVKYTKLNTWSNSYVTIGKEGEYDETISVVKGQKTIKKEQLQNLGSVCQYTGYSAKKAPEEIEIDWTGKTPVAQVKLSEF